MDRLFIQASMVIIAYTLSLVSSLGYPSHKDVTSQNLRINSSSC